MPVSAETLRIAEFWADFGSSTNNGLPSTSHILAMKDAGFNAMMLSEVNYGRQMYDLDYAVANPTNNTFKKYIDYVHGQGMKAFIKLNPGRYGSTGETSMNVPKFLDSSYEDLMIQHMKYLVSIGINGIELEEPIFGSAQKLQANDFFRRSRSVIPRPIIFGMNHPSNSIQNIIAGGYDYVTLDSERIFDYVATQPQTYPGGDSPDSAVLGAYNAWVSYMPNTKIVSGIFVSSKDGDNPSVISNVKLAATSGWSFKLWPSLALTPNEIASIKTIILNSPIPKTTTTPTPIPTSTPEVTGTLDIESTPTHADVYINGSNNNTGYTRNTFTLPAGTYSIRLVKYGYNNVIANVSIIAGQSTVKNYPMTPTSTPTPTPTPTTSIINNPGFESGTTFWGLYTNGVGTFSLASPGYEGNNAAKLAFSSTGTNIQLYQTGVTLEPDTSYRLSFEAYSSTGHDITVRLFKHVSPFTTYMPDYTANLDTKWQIFTIEFTTNVFSGIVNDGRLLFWLAPFAAAGDNYYIDNIQLEKLRLPTITTHPSDQDVDRGQTATFNVIANDTASMTYQWQKNGVDIPGATGVSYTTPSTIQSDNGSTFRVTVTNSAGSVTSNNAILIVMPKNLIENPGFESGISPWLFYTDGIGTFTVESSGYEGIKAAKIALSSSGSNIQLYQKDEALEPNTRYRLSFAAYSNTGDDLVVGLYKHDSPYTNYGLDFKTNLNTGWHTFTTEFTTSGFTGTVNDGRLRFWFAPFAAANDTYYIDNVRLEKVEASHNIYDVNGDGIVDNNDLSRVSLHFNEITTVPYPSFDVNADGKVDILDLILVSKSI